MARGKKITAAGLEDAIKEILEDYENDIEYNLAEITKSVTRKGVRAIKNESAATFGTTPKREEKYAKTWTSTFQTGRNSAQGTIYNTQAGLPHLLENGHVLSYVLRDGTKRTDGFVKGRPHISKVQDELSRVYEQEIMYKLSNI